jgi:hypothetical protein
MYTIKPNPYYFIWNHTRVWFLIQLLYKIQTHAMNTLFSECANHYMFQPILRPSSGVYDNTKIVAHICIQRLKQWCYIKYIQLIKIYNVCVLVHEDFLHNIVPRGEHITKRKLLHMFMEQQQPIVCNYI